MKRVILFLMTLLCCAVLSSCTPPEIQDGSLVQVYVTEEEGFFVVNNGQWVEPGESVTFELVPDVDNYVIGASFSGDYTLKERNGFTLLTLNDVRYPTRVSLEVQRSSGVKRGVRTITYQPNGGEGEPFDVTSSILVHTRPNTARDGFAREGHTLVGWNTSPEGDGLAVGLGSRVTVPQEGLTLYAVWAPWTDPALLEWETGEEGARITGYRGDEERLVIPARLDGAAVTAIGAGAFKDCSAREVVLCPGLLAVEDGAFENCAMEVLTLFDDVESVGDGAIEGCTALRTLHINAVEDPYGFSYRRESVLADKVDMLIASQGQRKMVFYGGCSIWYNLIGSEVAHKFSPDYRIINMGLNGTANSLVQMEIICPFLEEGDIFFHTPELSSVHQLMTYTDMYDGDDKIWCGLEYNYDLFSLVDLRETGGVLSSLQAYLIKKKPGGSYTDEYRDINGNSFIDYTGSVAQIRTQSRPPLSDAVDLDLDSLSDGLPVLAEMYRRYSEKGVRIYVSYACVNLDGVPTERQGNVDAMDALFRRTIGAMEGPVLISKLSDFLYREEDFFDTHYHLLTQAAYQNTAVWLRDLTAQMERDGLWPRSGT